MIGGNPVHGHEADIVAVARVFRAGIAQTHHQFHRRSFIAMSFKCALSLADEIGRY